MAFSPALIRVAGSGVAVGGDVGDGVSVGTGVGVVDGPGVLVGVGGTAFGRLQAERTNKTPSTRIYPNFCISTLYFLYGGVSML